MKNTSICLNCGKEFYDNGDDYCCEEEKDDTRRIYLNEYSKGI
jgi:hypothetical protein